MRSVLDFSLSLAVTQQVGVVLVEAIAQSGAGAALCYEPHISRSVVMKLFTGCWL